MANDPNKHPLSHSEGIPYSSDLEGIDFPFVAKDLVFLNAQELGVLKQKPDFSLDDVYLVWFTFTLGHWKAVCSTSIPDGRYYEVTYHAAKREAYIDTYVKTHNKAVKIDFNTAI